MSAKDDILNGANATAKKYRERIAELERQLVEAQEVKRERLTAFIRMTDLFESEKKARERAESSLEQERVKNAGCLTIAEGHDDADVKQGVYGWSLAYEAIRKLWSTINRLQEGQNKALQDSEVSRLKEELSQALGREKSMREVLEAIASGKPLAATFQHRLRLYTEAAIRALALQPGKPGEPKP